LSCYLCNYRGKSALGSVYGIDIIDNQVSSYYLADEISGTYRGMMIAIDDAHWCVFQQMTPVKLVRVLKELAATVKLSAFRKHPEARKSLGQNVKAVKINPMSPLLKSLHRERNRSTTLKGLLQDTAKLKNRSLCIIIE